jgi:hypothetical protein
MTISSFKLIRKCQDSQALIYAQQDFDLRWHEKITLKSHLLICKTCSHVSTNVGMLQTLLKQWRQDVDSNSAPD